MQVRAFFVDPEDNEYASDDSSSFDKASSVGYAEVVTTAYEQCSANGDYTAGVHGLDVGGGRCACFSGWASLGTGEHDSMALTQACNDRVSGMPPQFVAALGVSCWLPCLALSGVSAVLWGWRVVRGEYPLFDLSVQLWCSCPSLQPTGNLRF